MAEAVDDLGEDLGGGGYVSNSPFSGPMWPRGGSVRYIFTFFSLQTMYNLSINAFESHRCCYS